MSEFLKQYIVAALWSSVDDEGNPLDTVDNDLAPETIETMRADCERFQTLAAGLYDDDTKAAHDFWFTRNGHGVGFWESDRWPEPAATRLTEIAGSFGTCDLYIGDDGMIYAA